LAKKSNLEVMKLKATPTFLLVFIIFCNTRTKAQNYTLTEQKYRFKHANYCEKVLIDFQKTMGILRKKPILNEDIVAEIKSRIYHL
jgi:hypothetical protein